MLITDPCLGGWRWIQRGLRSQQLSILEPVKPTQRTGLAQNLSRSHGCRKEPGSPAWGLGCWGAEGGRKVDRATRSLAFAFDGRGHPLKVSGQGRLSSDILKSFLHDESTECRGSQVTPSHVLTFSLRNSSSMVTRAKKGHWDPITARGRPWTPGGNLKSWVSWSLLCLLKFPTCWRWG